MADNEVTALGDDALGGAASDEKLLKEVRERMQMCIDAEKDNRSDALDDLRFGAGQQWPEAMRRLREVESRPCLTINKLPAFIHQVTNDQRQNRSSIKVHPVDDSGDEDTADILQGLIRHIEYNSNADIAYDTAVNSAAAIGFGYFRLVTEYESDDSFDQEIKFKRIRNPFTVYIDPASTEPDGSDMRFAFITEEMLTSQIRLDYPDLDASSDTSLLAGLNDVTPTWMNGDKMRIAEYMRIEEKEATLYRLPDGTAKWSEDLAGTDPAVLKLLKSRQSKKREVWWYKVTGRQVLDRKKLNFNWVPVFPVYGDEVDIDGKVIRSGLIRHAKDPQRMYNFHMTSATEEVALRPKVPYIGAEGQFDGYEDEWNQANNRSFSFLTYKPTTVDGVMAPPPHRQQMADVPVGALQLAMHASDNIKATTGIFDASLGAQGNETSGRAITARQREGDVGNFHYSDNLHRTQRHAARCIMSAIPIVYDTERVVRLMGEDGKVTNATVNQPADDPQQDETGKVTAILNNIQDVSCYDITLTSGPSYTTLRQESVEAAMQLVQAYPPLMQIAGDKIVAMMDWHGAEEISERLKKTVPPQVLGNEGEDDPIPAQAQAQIQQLQAAVQQLSHALEQAHTEHTQLEQEHKAGLQKQAIASSATVQARQLHNEATVASAQIHQNTAVEVAKINADASRDVAEIGGLIQQLLVHMQADPRFQKAADEPDSE